jgi:membrane protein insertase Oxa1/YidC/SpoIIIJ
VLQKEYSKGMAMLYKKNNVKPYMLPVAMLVQVPVFTAFYFAFTGMCNIGLPSMVVESAAYGFDLTAAHPMHLFNVAVTTTMMLHVRTLCNTATALHAAACLWDSTPFI